MIQDYPHIRAWDEELHEIQILKSLFILTMVCLIMFQGIWLAESLRFPHVTSSCEHFNHFHVDNQGDRLMEASGDDVYSWNLAINGCTRFPAFAILAAGSCC
jgi:hypothetical protein